MRPPYTGGCAPEKHYPCTKSPLLRKERAFCTAMRPPFPSTLPRTTDRELDCECGNDQDSGGGSLPLHSIQGRQSQSPTDKSLPQQQDPPTHTPAPGGRAGLPPSLQIPLLLSGGAPPLRHLQGMVICAESTHTHIYFCIYKYMHTQHRP